LTNLILNFALVPNLSIYGAGSATLISASLAFFLFLTVAKRKVRKAAAQGAPPRL